MSRIYPNAVVVLSPFGHYRRGDLVTDAASIQAILSGGNASMVLVPVMPSASTLPSASEH